MLDGKYDSLLVRHTTQAELMKMFCESWEDGPASSSCVCMPGAVCTREQQGKSLPSELTLQQRETNK